MANFTTRAQDICQKKKLGAEHGVTIRDGNGVDIGWIYSAPYPNP